MSDLRNSELFNNPNDGVDELSAIAGLIDSHAPLITRVTIIRPKTPWYNRELSDAKRHLRRDWLLVHRDIYTSLQDVYGEQLVAANVRFSVRKYAVCLWCEGHVPSNEWDHRMQTTTSATRMQRLSCGYAERFRVYFSEKIMNVRSINV